MGHWVSNNWIFLVVCSVPPTPTPVLAPWPSHLAPSYNRCYISIRSHSHSDFAFSLQPVITLPYLFLLCSTYLLFPVLSTHQVLLLLFCTWPPRNKQTFSTLIFLWKCQRWKEYFPSHDLCHHSLRNFLCMYTHLCVSMCLHNNCVFLLVCIVKEIGTLLIQGMVMVTIIYVNSLWDYMDPHSSVKEIDLSEGAYKRWDNDLPK